MYCIFLGSKVFLTVRFLLLYERHAECSEDFIRWCWLLFSVDIHKILV